MPRGKNSAKSQKDGQHRKETKEEKALRLKTQREARETCMKLIPYAVGGVFIFLILFAMYVRSVPAKAVVAPQTPLDVNDPPVMAESLDSMPKKTEPAAVKEMPAEDVETVEL